MSIQLPPTQPPFYFGMPNSGKPDDPLDKLIASAVKHNGSPAFTSACDLLGPNLRKAALHLSKPGLTQAEKILALAPKSNASSNLHRSIQRSISSVYAFAVLSRLDECFQRALESRGLRRTCVNKEKTDLLDSMYRATSPYNEAWLVSLIAIEAMSFLDIAVKYADLEAAIRERLPQFRVIAAEGAF